MPIAAAMTPMKELIKLSLTLKQAANNDTISQILTNALASTVTMGIFPPSPPTPLVPAGIAATQSLLSSLAFNMKVAANNSGIAAAMSNAISILCPAVPPSGITVLKTLIENTVLNLSIAADNEVIATNLANAIVTYYTACGVT